MLVKMTINPDWEAADFWTEIWKTPDCPAEIKVMVRGYRTAYILSYGRAVVIESWALLFKSFFSDTRQPALIFSEDI